MRFVGAHDGALDIGEALAREFFDEVAVSHSLGSDFFAAHEFGYGTKRTCRGGLARVRLEG